MSSGTRNVLIALGVALFAVILGGRVAAEFAVELLWFRSLDYESVFWTFRGLSAAVRAASILVIAAIVAANLYVVSRSLGSLRLRRRYGNIEIAERLPQAYVFGAIAAVSLLSGWWISLGMPDAFSVLAAFRHVEWGVLEPIFGRDPAYYVFVYPLLQRAQTLTGILIFWMALLVTAAYVASGAIRADAASFTISPAARRHLGMLAAGLLVVFAWGFWLDRYDLLLSGNGVGGAIGYTDVHARLPGKILMTGLALIAAAGVAVGTWNGTRRAPLAGLVVLALGAFGSQVVYPSLIQRLVVEPNEFPREQPFIRDHLSFARLAYGLHVLEREPLPFRTTRELEPDAVMQALQGVPLWDERPLLTTFRQRQSLFPYYDFVSVHADRYGSGADLQQVAISVRELDVAQLPEQAQTWQNLRLNYVHGVGAVVSPMATMAGDGAPVFHVWDLEPRVSPAAPAGLRVDDPRVFFSQVSRGYIALGTNHPEPVGVPLDGAWKRALFAFAFQSRNLILSNELDATSRIVYRRAVAERVRALAPFLRFPQDGRAYPVITEGRIVWILDGFTSSPSFPLAPRAVVENFGTRYLRNSVKVTVDAITGETIFYLIDPQDPIAATYARLFPDLLRPADQMPPGIVRHLRYPTILHAVQAQILGDYHLRDERAFYGREDVWSIATENYADQPVMARPSYVTMTLPGQTEPEFALVVPFVSRGRQNMTALYVARNDPPNYGQQILLEFPRDELVPGPQQIESMIDQDPDISQQLSLWRQSGARVIRGHLISVPYDSTLIYVEPLFLEAQNAAIPQLERVIVAHRGRVMMAPTLGGALAGLFGGRPPEAAPGDRPAMDPLAALAPEQQQALQRAQQLLEQAEGHLRQGDWASFGRSWEALRQALRNAAITPPDP